MQITDDILADARALKPAALEALLAAGYAPARRIAHALSGDERVARAVADLLAQRGVRLLPRWRDPSTPENWFYHHALLTTRAVNAPAPEPLDDPLVARSAAASDPAYVAFVRALRHLPVQQREAFILHHGERLNSRLLGVAMDCSTQAAVTHLHAATDALNVVSEGQVDSRAAQLTEAYAALRAAQPDANLVARVHVRRVRRRMWIGRAIRVLIVATILALIGVAGWFFREDLLRLLKS